MNARQRKKEIAKWFTKVGDEIEDLKYCGNCHKKLDFKRNKYATKGYCNATCYGKQIL